MHGRRLQGPGFLAERGGNGQTRRRSGMDPGLPRIMPRFHRIRRRLSFLPALDPVAALTAEWRRLDLSSRIAGKSIALGVGSRGIRHLPLLVRTLVDLLREAGAEPFIVPAMGSHGGASATGQIETLRDL